MQNAKAMLDYSPRGDSAQVNPWPNSIYELEANMLKAYRYIHGYGW